MTTSDSPPPPPADLQRLIERALAADGHPPFSDGSLVGLASADRQLVWLESVAAAIVADGEAEFVVDPDARRRGYGREMLHRLLVDAPGDLLLWAHGGHPGAKALARTFGLQPVRELLQLRATVTGDRASDAGDRAGSRSAVGVSIRPWRAYSTDEEAWVELNARAFAAHPEQGSVTRADLDVLVHEPWFNADDFLLLWDNNELIGYCWLKVSTGSTSESSESNESSEHGEFYVVGVSPDRQGEGLGRLLVQAGLTRLAQRGIREASLYVEGDNTAALRLYRSFGFREHSIDIQYRWRSEPND